MQLAEHRDGKDAGCRWIAGAVGQKDSVGPQREDRRGRAACRDDGDAAAEAGQAARDVVLDAVVHADDVEIRGLSLAVAVLDRPRGFSRLVGLDAGYLARQIHAFEAGPLRGRDLQMRDVVTAVGGEGQAALGSPPVADAADDAARVDPGDSDEIPLPQPLLQGGLCPPV